MRIIAGLYKGRTLKGPEKGNRKIRPTSDRLRETLFNIMVHRGFDFTGSSGVDLYAGTGAIGLEALSRGASKVLWVDDAEEAIAIIRENVNKLGVTCGKELKKSALDALSGHDLAAYQPLRFIFLDPPYNAPETESVLKKIADRAASGGFLEKAAWVVLETSSRDKRDFQQSLGANFQCLLAREYGDTKLTCWQFVP